MSHILLSDPILSWLEPADHVILKRVSKESNATLTKYMKTKTTLHMRNTPYFNYGFSKHINKMYPAAKHITIDAIYSNGLFFHHYITEYTESVHILLKMAFTKKENKYFYDTKLYHNYVLKAFIKYLLEHPCVSLKILTISFYPKVHVNVVEKDCTVVSDTRSIHPPHCYLLYEQSEMEELAVNLDLLYSQREWKSFTVPYHFPGSNKLTKATFTGKIVMTKKDVEQQIKTMEYID